MTEPPKTFQRQLGPPEMDLHFHWLTAGILAITEVLTFFSLQGRLPVFRWYLITVAIRTGLPYFAYGDTPWMDAPVLLMRILAVTEFFIYVGLMVEFQARILLCIGCFQLAAVILIQNLTVQSSAIHPAFVFIRQSFHVEMLVAALTVMLWLWFHDLDCSGWIKRHGWMLTAYLFLYVAVGFLIACVPRYRCEALASFDLTATALMMLWCRTQSVSCETASA